MSKAKEKDYEVLVGIMAGMFLALFGGIVAILITLVWNPVGHSLPFAFLCGAFGGVIAGLVNPGSLTPRKKDNPE